MSPGMSGCVGGGRATPTHAYPPGAQLRRGSGTTPKAAPTPYILTLELVATGQVEAGQIHQPSQSLNVACCVWGCVVRLGVDERSEYQHVCVLVML